MSIDGKWNYEDLTWPEINEAVKAELRSSKSGWHSHPPPIIHDV